MAIAWSIGCRRAENDRVKRPAQQRFPELDCHVQGMVTCVTGTCAGASYNQSMSNVGGVAAATEDNGVETPAGSSYTRNHPYSSIVVENYLLSGEGSEKETRHIVFSLEEGMTYTPGDSIGVLPENCPRAVAEVLAALGFTGDERVLD